MKTVAFILHFFLCVQLFCQNREDTCCSSPDISNSIAFRGNVRFDNAYSLFKKDFDSTSLKNSIDFSGSLINAGFLFNDIDFSSFELLSGSLLFSSRNNVQKLVFAPFKINSRTSSNLLSNTRFNIAAKNGLLTLGIAIGGDYSDPHLNKFQKTRNNIFYKLPYCFPECYSDNEAQTKSKQQNIDSKNLGLIEFTKQRMRSVFKWSLGYNIQLFQLFQNHGTTPLADSLYYFTMKSHILSPYITSIFKGGSLIISYGMNFIFSRKAEDKSQKVVFYRGLQNIISKRICYLVPKDRLTNSKHYLRSFFAPSLYFGVSLESSLTKGEVKFVENGIKQSEVITPILDILLSPSAQLRVGLPIVTEKTISDQKKSNTGILFQYTFKLVNLH